MVIVGAVVAAAVLGGLVATLLSTKSPDTNAGQPPSQNSTATVTVGPPPGSPSAESSSSAPPSQAANEGPIDWGQAGQLIIDYYGSAAPATRWAALTPEAQQAYGSEDAFTQYWASYPQLSSRNARNVRLNQDGSVTVPVDVTYASGNQQHKEIRVVKVGGQLKIASDTK